MLNAGMVNARDPYFPPATFCESFAVFGRILRFQNPVKYSAMSRINLACTPRKALAAKCRAHFLIYINALRT